MIGRCILLYVSKANERVGRQDLQVGVQGFEKFLDDLEKAFDKQVERLRVARGKELIHRLHGDHDVPVAATGDVPARPLVEVLPYSVQFLGRRQGVKRQLFHVGFHQTFLGINGKDVVHQTLVAWTEL